ncbi:MAG: glycosyltransferase family 2 protein [Bacteroidetes bacterium]|nr:glycosyltransferase family 2 protein [Bacteroidota bacterium]MBK8680794.1 glycosyltransferase family 2 protein [Bacteroidota bacterium]
MDAINTHAPSVCIILVNYNTWEDTIECMESILKSNYSNFQIVVVENYSTNNSWEQLIKWCRGEAFPKVEASNPLFKYSNPPAIKPVMYLRANVEESDHLRLINTGGIKPILFIKSDENLGFAGGNNVGLRYAIFNSFDYMWLLNNDTVIESDTLKQLVDYGELHAKKKIGIIGSKLLLYHKPDTLQGMGAVFNKYSGKSKIIGAQQKDIGQFDNADVQCNYVIGAAMFVPRSFVLDVGVMSEDYFLYNEENDWASRAKRKGWSVGVAAKSKVYHKQGASTGNSPKKSKWQIKALHYKYRGKIKLYKKYYRPQLPFLYLHLLSRSATYLAKGNFSEAAVIYKAIFNTKF